MTIAKTVSTVRQGTPIADSGWKLAQDLDVQYEINGRYVIATNDAVDEYGHGSTKAEALEDLLTSLLDLYQAILEQRREAELAGELVETLGKLESLLVEGEK